MGVLVLATAAAATTLVVIGEEAALQGNARREAEAFFAAEAGLAEGRERLRLLSERTTGFTTYTSVMSTLPALPSMGANGETWFEVLPATPYTLASTGAQRAIDPDVTTAGRELRDAAGQLFAGFPTSTDVRYRVFLRDDRDEVPESAVADSNGQVWLVAIGEVDVGGGQPVRRATQALVTFTPGTVRVDCVGQKGGCADKTNASALDARTPSGSVRNL